MTAPSAAGAAAPARPEKTDAAHARRIIISSSIGNALEWYDFLVYGFFASIIGKLFFPADDEWVSLLFAVGSFGVSFITRPVGAIVLGMYADRKGRKAALTLSILLMIVGTLAIAVMPSYQQIGIVAPVTILLARLVQGFAVGGEFGSATAFMVEHSKHGRGYYASWQFASQGIATILAAGLGALLTASLTPADLEGWGWRLPFIFGLLVGPVGFYIRRHLDETPEFIAEQKKTTVDPQASFKAQWTNLLLAVGVGMLWSAIVKLEQPESVAPVHGAALWVAVGALVAKEGLFRAKGREFKAGEIITIDGSTGEILVGAPKRARDTATFASAPPGRAVRAGDCISSSLAFGENRSSISPASSSNTRIPNPVRAPVTAASTTRGSGERRGAVRLGTGRGYAGARRYRGECGARFRLDRSIALWET